MAAADDKGPSASLPPRSSLRRGRATPQSSLVGASHLDPSRRPTSAVAGAPDHLRELCGLAGARRGLGAQAQGDANAGKAVYEKKCLLCHGEKGDGKGAGAEHLAPRPRDFTKGLYKIRTTANKTPTDQDIFRIITEGMPGTSMPAWAVLPEKDRWNLVAYLKTFAAEAFKEAPKKLELPKEVASSEASIKRGKEMFEAIECHKCHGTEGRADGPSRAELKDEWGHPIAPANLAKRWTFRGGAGRTEIATRIANGVLGTPMPAFLDAVEKPEDIWHLTNFIMSLGPESPRYATLVTVTSVSDAIPDDPNADFWKKLAAQQRSAHGPGHRRPAQLQSRPSTWCRCGPPTTTRRSRSISRGTTPPRRRATASRPSPTRSRCSSRRRSRPGPSGPTS